MSLYLGDKQIASGSIAQINIPHSLGESKYSPTELNNVSWLDASSGTYYLGVTYPSFYNEFSNKIGEDFASGTIKLHTDTTITDYDLVINNVDGTFRLPLLDGSENLLSDKYIDYTSKWVSGDYTDIAPANGFISASVQYINQVSYFQIRNNTKSFHTQRTDIVTNGYNGATLEVSKGDSWTSSHANASNINIYWLRFYYYKGNGKLYFYIGETTQNANIIDFAQIREELNLKVSKDFAKSACFPSNLVGSLMLGASGTEYTAPANGYYCLAVTSNLSSWSITNTSNGLTSRAVNAGNGYSCSLYLPIRKGEKCRVDYQINPISYDFRFIYAEGDR